ncbi:MAG TPA: dephospho-CoA kinase, partial [Thiotrichaceae bacterium]|nr:dephospho-CoA kinase [Thiotrichaceae bacterium]
IVVDCTVEQQYNRVKIRDNVTDIQTKKIVDTQMKRDDRIDNADFIIDNTKSIAQLVPQVESLHNQLLARSSYKLKNDFIVNKR